jgi:class 3 adenylate cyclase
MSYATPFRRAEKALASFLAIGDRPLDTDDEKLKHHFLISMGVLMSFGGIVWGTISFYYGIVVPAMIPYGYTLLTAANLTYLNYSKNFRRVRLFQVSISLLLPFLFQWSLGGFVPTGAVMLWAMVALVGSLTFQDSKLSRRWLIAFLALTIFSGLIDGLVSRFRIDVSPQAITLFFVVNISVIAAIVFGLNIYLIQKREQSSRALVESERTMAQFAIKLAKYLSPQVYASIFSGEKDVQLESYRKKLTIFFSDIINFSEVTESMESESLTALLNDYLNEMSRIALQYGGTIDKYVGDAIMIFYGDPDTKGDKEDALTCVRMAIAMRSRMANLRHRWRAQGIYSPLHIRIGINTGYCTVGNFGSEDRLDYTIIGRQVNLASRLETEAEADQILISHETYSLVEDRVACDLKGEIQVKGIAKPIQTYQVIGLHEHRERKEMEERLEGLSLSVDVSRISDKVRARQVLTDAINLLQ